MAAPDLGIAKLKQPGYFCPHVAATPSGVCIASRRGNFRGQLLTGDLTQVILLRSLTRGRHCGDGGHGGQRMDCEPRRLCSAYSVWAERRGSSSNACILALRPPMIWAVYSPAQGASLDSPMAPAAQGQLQCYTPDVAQRTCRSLAAYKSNANGAIDNIAIVLIWQSPSISMTTVSPVVIKAIKCAD